ncbi:hypothetical protein [Streptomyces halstedii]|uniref:hypothetical protein n=1 Tax=Streptomyces halstedii TaxID=1944 RepID=UPI0036994E94
MHASQNENNLEKVVEAAQEELHYLRRRSQERATQRNHGHDYNKLTEARRKFDNYAGKVVQDHEKERTENRHGSRE